MMVLEELNKRAHPVKRSQEIFYVLEDNDILICSELTRSTDHHIPPYEVAALALEHDMVPHRYLKNMTTISRNQQARICRSRILVCGCGGLGGCVIHLAARVGFGLIRCVDPDCFSPSDANRQWYCLTNTEGKNKSQTTRSITYQINPIVSIEAVSDYISPEHLVGVDIVVDALDNVPDRLNLDLWCKEQCLPLVHGAVRGWWGQALTVMPESLIRLASLYDPSITNQMPEVEELLGVLSPTVGTVASLQVTEATRLAAQLCPLYDGILLYVDLEAGEFYRINLK